VTGCPHGVDQLGKECLRQGLPLCLKHLEELVCVGRSRVVVSYSAVQLVPHMLYGIQIWADGRPVHSVDLCCLHKVVCNDGMVWARIVVLKNGARTNELQGGYHQTCHNFIAVPQPC
jgi:hypothetical protein